MKNDVIVVVLVVDEDLPDCEATIAEETWQLVVSKRHGSQFAPVGSQIVIAGQDLVALFTLNVIPDGHAPNELHVSPRVKDSVYKGIEFLEI